MHSGVDIPNYLDEPESSQNESEKRLSIDTIS